MPKSLMQSVVSQLQVERERIEKELQGVSAALAAFGKVYAQGRPGNGVRKRTMSAAGRSRIAAAQRKRWAKIRAAAKSK